MTSQDRYKDFMDFMSYYMSYFESERVNDQLRKVIGARGKKASRR